MNDPTAPDSDTVDLAAERNLLVRVGAAMTIAGDSIDEVGSRLSGIARARGVSDLSVVVLPTALFVQTWNGEHASVQLEAYPNERARFDQIGALYELFDRAERPGLDAVDAVAELDEILRAPLALGAVVRTVGLGVLSVGFSLSLQPTLPDMAAAFVLGILVGVLRLLSWPGFQAVLPVVAAFLVASIVFATTETFETGNPVRTLLVPGAAGLISATEVAISDSPLTGDLVDTLSAVMAIALGVLIGTATFRAGQAGLDGAVRTIPPQLSRTSKRLDLTRHWHRRSSIADDAGDPGLPHDTKKRGGGSSASPPTSTTGPT